MLHSTFSEVTQIGSCYLEYVEYVGSAAGCGLGGGGGEFNAGFP